MLGDRTRFQLDPNDGGVYVRSMAAKDYLGGVSELTYPTMTVMRSKFDFLIIRVHFEGIIKIEWIKGSQKPNKIGKIKQKA